MLDERLREFDFGEIEGKRFDDLEDKIQKGLLLFDGFVAPGGEAVDTFRDRVAGFFAGLTHGRHLVVTHGGVIRLLMREQGSDLRIDPGGLVHLSTTRSEGWKPQLTITESVGHGD